MRTVSGLPFIMHSFDNFVKIHHIQNALYPGAVIRDEHLNQAYNWL